MLPLTDAEFEKPVAPIKGLKIRAISWHGFAGGVEGGGTGGGSSEVGLAWDARKG
jgi:hypothetical protein